MMYELRPDGRKLRSGKNLVDLPEESFDGKLPGKFRKKHLEALNAIYGVGLGLAESGREVPLTAAEIIKIIDKQVLKDLERFGFVEAHLVELKGNGKSLGGRKCIVVSPTGKAVIKFFDSAVTEVLEQAQPADPQTVQSSEPSAQP